MGNFTTYVCDVCKSESLSDVGWFILTPSDKRDQELDVCPNENCLREAIYGVLKISGFLTLCNA